MFFVVPSSESGMNGGEEFEPRMNADERGWKKRIDNPVLSVCICVHPWFSFSFSPKTEVEPRMARRGTDEEIWKNFHRQGAK